MSTIVGGGKTQRVGTPEAGAGQAGSGQVATAVLAVVKDPAVAVPVAIKNAAAHAQTILPALQNVLSQRFDQPLSKEAAAKQPSMVSQAKDVDTSGVPARSLENVIAALSARVEARAHRGLLVAGLAELSHPGEIEAFAKYALANLGRDPKYDNRGVRYGLSEEERRQRVSGIVTLWAGELNAIMPGTRAVWMAAVGQPNTGS